MTDNLKKVRSPDYNFNFDRTTGFFARWGKTLQDDPDFSPRGPEIADIEVTTSCSGPAGKVCSFCYKANTPKGTNMSFETFKEIFHKLPTNLTQIAFGADANLKANPDIWKMFDYCRNNDYNKVVPNVTVANVDDEVADKLAAVCGAVAVSRYSNKDWCYDTIKRLVDRGMSQVNIHQMISEETFEQAMETINDYGTDPRLKGMKAIVFLSLKRVGRGKNNTQLSQDKFKLLVDTAMSKNVPIGFDSCSANKFLRAVKDREDYNKLAVCTEPCESTCFSLYVNVEGKYYPCSFSEGNGEWEDGIDLTKVDDFMTDVWNSERTLKFRNDLLGNKDENGVRACPLFEI